MCLSLLRPGGSSKITLGLRRHPHGPKELKSFASVLRSSFCVESEGAPFTNLVEVMDTLRSALSALPFIRNTFDFVRGVPSHTEDQHVNALLSMLLKESLFIN